MDASLYAEIVGRAPVGICVLEAPSLQIVAANDEYLRLAGIAERGQALGSFPEAHPAGTLTRELLPAWRSALSTNAPASAVEVRLPGRSGRTFAVQCVPLNHPDGTQCALMSTVLETTESRRAEQALRESEERYRTLFESNPHPMWVFDEKTLCFLAVNDAAVEHYGYTRDEFLAMTVKEIRPPEEVPALLADIARKRPGLDHAGIWRHRKKDGTPITVEITSHAVEFAGRPAVVVLAHDVTERMQAAQDLENAHQRVLAAEREKKRFYRDVIRLVTRDRFHLVDSNEIPTVGDPVLEMALDDPAKYRALRSRLREAAQSAGMASEQVEDLVLAVGEAATNAIKHAVGGRCAVYLGSDRVSARVSDRGGGIHPDDIPATLLQRGFSTKVSLGMGYALILELVDSVWLATDVGGTVIQLEKWIHPEEHVESPIPESWKRL